MGVAYTKRLDKGAPLTPTEQDANDTNFANAIDALAAAFGVVLNLDGTLNAAGIASVLPPGTIIGTVHPTLGANAGVDGWIYANGSSVVRVSPYASLFGLIGTLYGSVDGTHFNLPDYRGCTLVGVSPGTLSPGRTSAFILGQEYTAEIGEESHKLTASEGPPHTHNVDGSEVQSNTSGGQLIEHAAPLPDLYLNLATKKYWTGTAGGHDILTDSALGLGIAGPPVAIAHENRQPSAVIRWLVKL